MPRSDELFKFRTATTMSEETRSLNTSLSGDARVGRINNVGRDYFELVGGVVGVGVPHFVGVPDRNMGFVGRSDELSRLDDAAGAMVIAQVTAGMGGIGKTALAVEYAHEQREAGVEAIRWLHAENREALVTQYSRIGPALGLDVAALALDDQLAAVRNWFETTDHSWLLVFDNVARPNDLDNLLPTQGNGQVVITTRHQDWAKTNTSVVQLGVLPEQDAIALLNTMSALSDMDGAAKLVERLGYLALAVEKAGVFCRKLGKTYGEYLEMFEKRLPEVLKTQGNYGDAVMATVWDASIETAELEAAGARNLLSVLAYLNADNISTGLVHGNNDEPLLCNGNDLEVDNALAELANYSLITKQNESLSMHRVIQDISRHNNDSNDALATAIRVLRNGHPEDPTQPDTWDACAELEPHIVAVNRNTSPQTTPEPAKLSWLLDQYGSYLQHSGNPMAAPAIFERALDIDRHYLGPEHPNTLTAQANLAASYWQAGRTNEAITIEEQVLETMRRTVGPEHPDTLTTQANLAVSYRQAGRTNEAITIEEQVLKTRHRTLGAEHPNTLTSQKIIKRWKSDSSEQ